MNIKNLTTLLLAKIVAVSLVFSAAPEAEARSKRHDRVKHYPTVQEYITPAFYESGVFANRGNGWIIEDRAKKRRVKKAKVRQVAKKKYAVAKKCHCRKK